MTESTDHQPVLVYETKLAAKRRLNNQMRGNLQGLVDDAKKERDHIGTVLAESGIELISADDQPDDLSYENRKFTVLGKLVGVAGLMDQARESAPSLAIIEKTPIMEVLEAEDSLPFVLKRPIHDTRGVNKYLINQPDQLETLKKYFAERDYMAENWFAEPYIATPGNVNSSYRLVVTATGQVIASALLYQPRIEGKKVTAEFTDSKLGFKRNAEGWEDFADPESKWFLNADAVTSNVSTGGSIIPLRVSGEIGTELNPTAEEKDILGAHNIDDQETPANLIKAAIDLGRGVGPSMALVLGVDFLQSEDGSHHLLEINAYPGTDSILTWWDIDPEVASTTRARRDRISDDLIRVVGDSLKNLQ